jgi:uncharacterized protein with PIN domain
MEPRFLVDLIVGRLATWLRAMVYDAELFLDFSEGRMVQTALLENRVLLSRNTRFLRRLVITSGSLKAILISHDVIIQQLAKVVSEFALWHHDLFTRCVVRNAVLVQCTIDDDSGRVPSYVIDTQSHYKECPVCLRHYLLARDTCKYNVHGD